jgi:hypothetical protein
MSEPERCVAARFTLSAEPSPGLLPRLLQPFARRDLVPDRLVARREGAAMRVEIGLDAMPAGMVHLVAGNLSQVVGVTELRCTDEGGVAQVLRAA